MYEEGDMETLEEALGAKPGPQHETGKELPSL